MRNNVKKVLSAVILSAFIAAPGFAQQKYQSPTTKTNPYTYKPSYQQPSYPQQYQQQYQMQPLQGRVATIPQGTTLNVSVQSTITSQYTTTGDRITTILGNDIYAGNVLVLPAGSQVIGQVVAAQKAGGFGSNGSLNIRFSTAITPNGQSIPISGKIVTEDGTGVIYGGTTAGRVAKTAGTTVIGAGLGAALGTGLGAASGGKAGKGAIYGTAIGSGVGLLGNAFRKGSEAVITPGNKIEIMLDQPASVNSAGY